MIQVKSFYESLNEFEEKFEELAGKYEGVSDHSKELEHVINDYSRFITSDSNKVMWEQLAPQDSSKYKQVLTDLRKNSAYCVAMSEKYRALNLLNGKADVSDYFKNIESCIRTEFGSFQADSKSKVLLIGSGAFPMTPLLIAQQTGAEVVGIDIDEEAITLGDSVVKILGHGLNIRLEQTSAENLAFTKEATHIIFSSTVGIKFEILKKLHTLTNEEVVVIMRYGDNLKSLFNYPMEKVDEQNWVMVENVLRPDQVFDIALYKKCKLKQ